MKRLAKIARSATPSTGIQFRATAYTAVGAREFLRDVIALANAPVEGARFIIVGASIDAGGKKEICEIDRDDFSGKPSYQALANEFIEPPLRIKYQPVSVDGQRLGIYEIGDCQDRPYMMRIDHSETLRRGDAFQRINKIAVKLGRRQLQTMFEAKFRESVSADKIDVGFPGDIIYKDQQIEVCDLSDLPSAIAGTKLNQLLAIKSDAKRGTGITGATSRLARLTHARLFGTEIPYEDRSEKELVEELRQIERQYRDHDQHFLFETHAEKVQLVVFNQGDEVIRDASLSVIMPNHHEFHVAPQLPKLPRKEQFVERLEGEQADYPSVSMDDDSIHVSGKLGDIPPGEFVQVFGVPLRLCVGSGLKGKRFGMQYSLFAQNLRAPAEGKLKLLF